MTKLLYIEASPRKKRSHSINVAKVFLKEYEKHNPEDNIETLDLWSVELPPFNGEILDIKYQIMHGSEISHKQELEWSQVREMFNQFNAADKYVFSVPMWNFGVPYKLKHYIDLITQPNLSWSFSPDDGYKGLVAGKVAIFYSSGGDYSELSESKSLDSQKKPFENWLNFIGLTEAFKINIFPTIGLPQDVQEAVEIAKDNAKNLAQSF